MSDGPGCVAAPGAISLAVALRPRRPPPGPGRWDSIADLPAISAFVPVPDVALVEALDDGSLGVGQGPVHLVPTVAPLRMQESALLRLKNSVLMVTLGSSQRRRPSTSPAPEGLRRQQGYCSSTGRWRRL